MKSEELCPICHAKLDCIITTQDNVIYKHYIKNEIVFCDENGLKRVNKEYNNLFNYLGKK